VEDLIPRQSHPSLQTSSSSTTAYRASSSPIPSRLPSSASSASHSSCTSSWDSPAGIDQVPLTAAELKLREADSKSSEDSESSSSETETASVASRAKSTTDLGSSPQSARASRFSSARDVTRPVSSSNLDALVSPRRPSLGGPVDISDAASDAGSTVSKRSTRSTKSSHKHKHKHKHRTEDALSASAIANKRLNAMMNSSSSLNGSSENVQQKKHKHKHKHKHNKERRKSKSLNMPSLLEDVEEKDDALSPIEPNGPVVANGVNTFVTPLPRPVAPSAGASNLNPERTDKPQPSGSDQS